MSSENGVQALNGVRLDPAAVERQLERVISSAGFRKCTQLGRFLRFAVVQALAGADGVSKETLIAVEIFGRRPDYDPGADPIVRVEARRLRDKLARYYQSEGRTDPIRIQMPKGGYLPVFELQELAGAPEARSNAAPEARSNVPPEARSNVPPEARSNVAPEARFNVETRSIAVLPFADRSLSRSLDALVDGLTARLIARLATCPGLRLVSSTSVFQFKNRTQDARTIGAELNATLLLEGSLRKAGKWLRCDTQLISAADGLHLWAGSFDSSRHGSFALEDELAERIAEGVSRWLFCMLPL